MTRQLDLLGHGTLKLKPKPGRAEPRFWVRRFMIWSKPGVILREIRLRPGLNIVWAPDPADREDVPDEEPTVGHGSGKTLFCRLLRYCLGEDRRAPAEQRDRIAEAFPEGRVGAEVMLNGVRWSVIRPIGAGRQHRAVRDVDLEQAAIAEDATTGIAKFMEAVVTGLLSNDVVDLIPGGGSTNAWQVALAWLSRDQECRFDKLLDWRSADSDSGSPARHLSMQQRQDSLRALIGAIVPDEHKFRAELDSLEVSRGTVGQDLDRMEWRANRLLSELVQELGVDPEDLLPGRMAVEPLRDAAKTNLGRVTRVDPAPCGINLEGLRSDLDKASARIADLQIRESALQARIPEIKKSINFIKGEIPGASARAADAENPVCPICEVSIDLALAEGCKLSHKLPNLEDAKRRLAARKQEHSHELSRLAANEEELTQATQEMQSASGDYYAARQQLQEAERIRDSQSDAWFKARRLIDDVVRLDESLAEQERTRIRITALEQEIQSKRDRIVALREAQAEVFNDLSTFFNSIIRALIGKEAVGRVFLDGNGLRASVDLGGERSTAAIESLKVIAFDLATMCMSIEGRTHLPPFLVHDSPREADLGLSVYHQLFRSVHGLEELTDQPLFQYIVTTTTSPPEELHVAPWLVETLGGASEERLLKRDL